MGSTTADKGGQPASAEDSAKRDGGSDLSAQFQIPLDEDNVTPLDLLEADILQTPLLTKDDARRRLGGIYYPKLRASLDRRHKDAEIAVAGISGMVLSLGIGETDELGILVNRGVIQFNWSEVRKLLLAVNELGDEVRRWIPDEDERHALLVTLFGIASQLQVSVGRENARAIEGGAKGDDPSEHLALDLRLIEPQIERAHERFLEDAQRGAQLRYAIGMAGGGAALLLISTLLGFGFLHWDVEAVNGVGLLAGGLGACVSVLQRMTSGTLVLNFQAVGRMLTTFGALRPFIGGVFGLLTYCVFAAGLVSAIVLPDDPGEELAFVAVFAFAAGFNERFFQDMLARASDGIAAQEPPAAIEAGSRR